jgi:hypothetical protein
MKDEFHRKARELAPDLLRFGNEAGKNLFRVLMGRQARVEQAEKELLVAVDTLFSARTLWTAMHLRLWHTSWARFLWGDLRQERYRLLYSVQQRAKKEAIPQITKGILPEVAVGAIRPPLEKKTPSLFFADKVATARGTHSGRMHRSRRDVAPFAGPEGMRLAIHGESHFAFEDDVSGLGGVRVFRIEGVRVVLPDVGVGEAFLAKLFFERFDVHSRMKPQS